MTKILASGDVHIWDYQHHNLFDDHKFRLNQFIKLAHRYVEIAKEHNCEYMVLCGDIVHRPMIPSHIAHVIDQFFEILHTQFDKDHLLFYLGQHDLNTKEQIQKLDDSLIHIIARHGTYVDQQILRIGKSRVAFRNWTPVQDFSFIEEPVDLCFGHITLHEQFGQVFDDTKYRLGFAGDIHQPISIGHTHSTNVPIQHHLADSAVGSVIVVDSDTLEWSRVVTETADCKFLKMYYNDDPMVDAIPVAAMDYVVTVQRPTTVVKVDNYVKSVDLDGIIDATVALTDLGDLHREISTMVDRTGIDPVDLNFVVESLEIKNNRSIAEFTFTPEAGTTLICGKNGSGKSSFVHALKVLFKPPKSLKDSIKRGCKEMSITATITYQGRKHYIRRGVTGKTGYLDYEINDIPVPSVSMAEKQSVLEANLPFIEFFDVLYREQSCGNLLADYGYNQRIHLLNSVLGTQLVSRYYDATLPMVKQAATNITNTKTAITKLAGTIEALEGDYALIDDKATITAELNEAGIMCKSCQSELANKAKLDTITAQHANYSQLMDAYAYDEALVVGGVEHISAAAEACNVALGQHTAWNNAKLARDAAVVEFASYVYDSELLLANDIDVIPTQITALQVEKEAAFKEVFTNKSTIDACNTRITSLKKTITSHTKAIDDTETHCSLCNHPHNEESLLHSIQVHTDAIAECDAELAELAEMLTELSSFNAVDANNRIATLDEAIAAKQAIIAQLRVELSTKEKSDRCAERVSLADDALAALPLPVDSADTLWSTLATLTTQHTSIVAEIAKKQKYDAAKASMKDVEVQIIALRDQLVTKFSIDELKDLIATYQASEVSLRDQLSTIRSLELQQAKLKAAESESIELGTTLSVQESDLASIKSYSELFSPKGAVIQSTFTQIAKVLSDEHLRVETVKTLSNGEARIDFDIELMVGGAFFGYDHLSGGQKTLVDIIFLCRLFEISGRAGILILDEYLKQLDRDAVDTAMEHITKAPINSILIISHVESFNQYDRRINARLVSGGVSATTVYEREGA